MTVLNDIIAILEVIFIGIAVWVVTVEILRYRYRNH
jgi:hypothetical protein